MLTTTESERGALRLPPYARKVTSLRAQAKAPNMAVLVVDGWEPLSNLDEYAPWVLVIPDDEPPEAFDFRCVAGLFVLVVAGDIDRVDRIVNQVLRFHPKTVFGWPEERQQLAIYTRVAA